MIFKFPKVGIRAVIDGRFGGIREGQEKQVMQLAQNAARLISENLKYPDGTPVQCVISDTCIGGVHEAAMCAEKFKNENVGVSLSVTACWCYGSETMDMEHDTPKAVWGFNGTERPGAVYLAAVLAAHSQKGLPAFGIYGHDVQDLTDLAYEDMPEDVKKNILRFAKAGLAVAIMKGKSYLSMGNVAMGIGGSIVNADFFEEYLGMRVEYVDMSEFVRRFDENIYDKDEFEKAYAWFKDTCIIGEDIANPPEKQHDAARKDEVLKTSIKMALIARDLMIGNPKLHELGFYEEAMGHNAILAGFQGQRQWTDHFPNGDFMESIMNSSFDWNGIRNPYLVATENDCLNGVAMLFGYLLTNAASVFADVRTYWSPDAVKRVTGYTLEGNAKNGIIHLINSGAASLDGTGRQTKDGKPAMKPFWEITEKEAEDCVKATQWRYANLGYFRGGGYSANFLTKGGMPVTMLRLNLIHGLGPVLHVAEGWTCDLPEEVHHKLDIRTDPTWPTTWFAPRLTGKGAFTSVYEVMNHWGANHGAFCYGHVGADVITMASMLRIPVAMHNVPDEDVYRPSAWNAFGTQDLEGADYRACKNFGPIYKK